MCTYMYGQTFVCSCGSAILTHYHQCVIIKRCCLARQWGNMLKVKASCSQAPPLAFCHLPYTASNGKVRGGRRTWLKFTVNLSAKLFENKFVTHKINMYYSPHKEHIYNSYKGVTNMYEDCLDSNSWHTSVWPSTLARSHAVFPSCILIEKLLLWRVQWLDNLTDYIFYWSQESETLYYR